MEKVFESGDCQLFMITVPCMLCSIWIHWDWIDEQGLLSLSISSTDAFFSRSNAENTVKERCMSSSNWSRWLWLELHLHTCAMDSSPPLWSECWLLWCLYAQHLDRANMQVRARPARQVQNCHGKKVPMPNFKVLNLVWTCSLGWTAVEPRPRNSIGVITKVSCRNVGYQRWWSQLIACRPSHI